MEYSSFNFAFNDDSLRIPHVVKYVYLPVIDLKDTETSVLGKLLLLVLGGVRMLQKKQNV